MTFQRLLSVVLALACFGWGSTFGLSQQPPDLLPPQAGTQQLVVVSVWEPQNPSARFQRLYRQELTLLMDRLGVQSMHTSYEDATQRSFSGRIVVLRLHTCPDAIRSAVPKVSPVALGWTHASNGDITPFAAIDLTGLRTFLRIAEESQSSPADQDVLARATARVAAHEVFHMLTRSSAHSETGLMKEGLSADELRRQIPPDWTQQNRKMAIEALPGRRGGVVAALTAEQSSATDRK